MQIYDHARFILEYMHAQGSTCSHLTIVSTATDGDGHLVLGAELDGSHDISNVGNLNDHGWLLVDHAVVDGASVVVGAIARTDDVATDRGNERVELFRNEMVHHRLMWLIDQCEVAYEIM